MYQIVENITFFNNKTDEIIRSMIKWTPLHVFFYMYMS